MQVFIKICTVCEIPKFSDSFYNSSASKDGKCYRCKRCDNKARVSYDKRHRGRRLANQRKANRKHKYGLTEDQYGELIKSQKGLCGICQCVMTQEEGNKHKPTTLCIDHDHKTNKVRGLLCTKCNKGLGLLGDNIESIEKTLKYLNAEIH